MAPGSLSPLSHPRPGGRGRAAGVLKQPGTAGFLPWRESESGDRGAPGGRLFFSDSAQPLKAEGAGSSLIALAAPLSLPQLQPFPGLLAPLEIP